MISKLMEYRNYFLDSSKPKIFNPHHKESEIIKVERDFEMMISSMEEAGINHPKSLTVFEFYIRIKHFEKKYKPKNSVNNH